eukprot:TRINITY_DN34130_c0_g1_i1.p1 TRINITY_DN34130_c0_g1~~TRINITY_DN34130_c0_g1_i1.p1  ORF type:complete len:1145 (-),score=210.49 TRINITY_DN34130_c0_g1_i1:21-3455(-)
MAPSGVNKARFSAKSTAADLLDDFLSSDIPGSDALGTFMTSSAEGGCAAHEDGEEWLQKIQAAADAALRGERESGSSSESVFLKRLYTAYEEAIAAGDDEAAKAVHDAIRAEGGTLPAASNLNGRSRVPETASSRTCSAASQKPPLPAAPCESKRAYPGAGGCHARIPMSGRVRAASPRVAKHPRTPREALKAKFGRMQDLISAQLASFPRQPGGVPAKSPSSCNAGAYEGGSACQQPQQKQQHRAHQQEQAKAEEYDEEQLVQDLENPGPQRLGGVFSWPAGDLHPDFIGKAQQAYRQRQVRGILQSGGLVNQINFNSALSGSMEQELPASGATQFFRDAVNNWACGVTGAYRCLLDVASTLSFACEIPFDDLPGRASWHSLAAITGLPGGDELTGTLASSGAASVFARGPASLIHETLRDVRSEAGLLDEAIMTIEELHQGLRSLEIRYRSGNSIDNCSLLRVVTCRELLRFLFNGVGGGVQRNTLENTSPAQALARALRLSASDVEADARCENLETLREAPMGWDKCRATLSAMKRNLQEELSDLQTYGPYAALGLEYDASDSAIRRAYRDLCLLHHPDKGGDTAVFQSLQQAHDTLMEDRRKGLRPRKPTRARRETSKQTTWPQSPPNAGSPGTSSHRGSAGPSCESESPTAGKTRTKNARRAKEPSGAESQATDAEAQASAQELLNEVAKLSIRAQEAADNAKASAEETTEFIGVFEESLKQIASDEYDLDFFSNHVCGILKTMQAVVEATSLTASIAGDASRRTVAVGILGADGDRMEEIMVSSQNCAEAGIAAADVSAACEVLAHRVAHAWKAIETGTLLFQFESFAELAAAARLAGEAVQETVQTAASASASVDAAVRAARAAVLPGLSAKSYCRQRQSQQSEFHDYSSEQPKAASDDAKKDAGWRNLNPPGSPTSGQPTASSETSSHEHPFTAGGCEGAGSPSSRHRPSMRTQATDHADESVPPNSARPGAGTQARSSSAGARGRTEALVRRRVEAHDELVALNKDVLKLQRQVQQTLLASPLLLPKSCALQRHRVFAVMAEVLVEISQELSQEGHAVLLKKLPEVLCGCTDVSLCDARAGAIRLAALTDLDMLTCTLKGQFLSMLVAALPLHKAEIEMALEQTVQSLHAWIKAC